MTNTFVTAGELCANHIGTLIRFRQWDNNRETAVVTTAELRQLSANGDEVHIRVGLMAEVEETLGIDQPVTLCPSDSYNDVATLALYDGRV